MAAGVQSGKLVDFSNGKLADAVWILDQNGNVITSFGGGGGAATIADGADVAEGATTDAVVAAGAAGTLSAKLRRLTTDLAAVLALFPTAAALGDTDANPTTTVVAASTKVWTGSVWQRWHSANVEAGSASAGGIAGVHSYLRDQTNAQFVYQRTPVTFKTFTISASAAETTIWTPAAGKKFRLMGIVLFSNTASVLTFRDNTGGTTIFLGGVAASAVYQTPPMGNGILSAAANNVLTLQCGTASTVNGTVFGSDE